MASTFQLPDPNMNLREALALFREDQGLTEKYANTGAKSQALFDQHDVIHVLFGTDTRFMQEARTDFWTLFGCDAKWSEMKEYMGIPEQKELFAEHGLPKLVGGFLASLPLMAVIAFRARKLKRKWRWTEYKRYLDTPVSEIRRKYGIDRVIV